jgi:hypothetical protein
VVSGFTITNGFTRSADDAGVVSHGGADYTGGGVHCSDREGIISNCVVSGCGSYRGGGVFRGKTYNSVLFGNRALYGGGGVSDSSVYGTLTYSNKCASTVNYSGIFFPYHVEDCTVLDGCGNFYFNEIKAINNVYAGVVYKESKTFATNTFNCVYNSKYAKASLFEGFEGIVSADAENLKFDENFRPVIGANAAIDCYSAAHATVPYAKTDVLGGQRVYNGARDIGAVEADWRKTYARDLAVKSLSVLKVGENVVESTEKSVVVPAGERMEINWSGRGESNVDYALKAKVDVGAELKIYLNDELFAAVQGDGNEQEFAFRRGVPMNELKFECIGETGSAELYAFERYVPAMTIYVK